jgi:hypothetical protein
MGGDLANAVKDRDPGKTATVGTRGNGNGLSGGLFPKVGFFCGSRKIGVSPSRRAIFTRKKRLGFVLRLLRVRAAGRFVFLLLLPGDFPLSLLEGEFCSCHCSPPSASLPLSGKL